MEDGGRSLGRTWEAAVVRRRASSAATLSRCASVSRPACSSSSQTRSGKKNGTRAAMLSAAASAWSMAPSNVAATTRSIASAGCTQLPRPSPATRNARRQQQQPPRQPPRQPPTHRPRSTDGTAPPRMGLERTGAAPDRLAPRDKGERGRRRLPGRRPRRAQLQWEGLRAEEPGRERAVGHGLPGQLPLTAAVWISIGIAAELPLTAVLGIVHGGCSCKP